MYITETLGRASMMYRTKEQVLAVASTDSNLHMFVERHGIYLCNISINVWTGHVTGFSSLLEVQHIFLLDTKVFESKKSPYR